MSEIKSIVNKIGTNNHIYSPEEVRLFFEMHNFKENCVELLKKKSPATIDYLVGHFVIQGLINNGGRKLDIDEMIYLYMTRTTEDNHLCKGGFCRDRTIFISNELGYDLYCSYKCAEYLTKEILIEYLESWAEVNYAPLLTPEDLSGSFDYYAFGTVLVEHFLTAERNTGNYILNEYATLFEKVYKNGVILDHYEFNKTFEQAAYLYIHNESIDDQKCLECGNNNTIYRNYRLGHSWFCNDVCAEHYRKKHAKDDISTLCVVLRKYKIDDREIMTKSELSQFLKNINYDSSYECILEKNHPNTHKYIKNMRQFSFDINAYLYYTNSGATYYICQYCKEKLVIFDDIREGFSDLSTCGDKVCNELAEKDL